MGKLGIAFKQTLNGTGTPIIANRGPWTSRISDIRDILSNCPEALHDPDRQVLFMTFTAAGTYIVVAHTLPNRLKDNMAGWIFIPASMDISGAEVEEAINRVRAIVSAPNTPPETQLQQMFDTEYPDLPAPARISPSTGKQPAMRVYGVEFSLPELLGPDRYQNYYSQYQAILLVRSASEVTNAVDLTNKPLTEKITVMPFDRNRVFELLHVDAVLTGEDGTPFDRPVMAERNSRIMLTAVRNGYAPAQMAVRAVADRSEPTIEVYPQWMLNVSRSDFRISGAKGQPVDTEARIFIEGHALEGKAVIDENRARHASLRVEAPGCKPYTGTVDLTKPRPWRVSLEAAPTTRTYSIRLTNDRTTQLSLENTFGLSQPLRGYRLDGGIFHYRGGGNAWLDRGIGFAAGLLLLGIIWAIVAMVGGSDKPAATVPAEPAEEAAAADSTAKDEAQNKHPENFEEAVSYLDNNARYVREDMEKISGLQGFFDELNTYQLDRIKGRMSYLQASENYNRILAAFDKYPERVRTNSYEPKNDVITVENYIKLVGREPTKEELERQKGAAASNPAGGRHGATPGTSRPGASHGAPAPGNGKSGNHNTPKPPKDNEETR